MRLREPPRDLRRGALILQRLAIVFLFRRQLQISGGEPAQILDPNDLLTGLFLHTVQHLSIGTQKFAAVYLLVHGTIKLWLIAGLLRKRLWYFPVAMTVFSLFIVYQLYRYTNTHSGWLLVITALDLVIIALTWHEYRGLKLERTASMDA